MRPRLSQLLALVLLGIGEAACKNGSSPPPPAEVLPSGFDAAYRARLDSFDLALAALSRLPSQRDADTAKLAFRRARAAFKSGYLLQFEDHLRATSLNAPLTPVVDEDDHSNVLAPRGLQVIESSLFPRPSEDFAEVMSHEVEEMRRMVGVVGRDSSYRRARTWPVPFEAARMELARVVTLGLAGFDATLSKDGIVESAEALRGIKEGLDAYEPIMRRRDPSGWRLLQGSLDAAIDALATAPEFDRFDRFGFEVRFARPLAAALARLQRSLGLPEPDEIDPWAPGMTDSYAAGSLDPRWFAPDYAHLQPPRSSASAASCFSIRGCRRPSTGPAPRAISLPLGLPTAEGWPRSMPGMGWFGIHRPCSTPVFSGDNSRISGWHSSSFSSRR